MKWAPGAGRKIALGLVIIVVIIGGGITVAYDSYHKATLGTSGGAPVTFRVPQGATLSGLGPALQASGVISSSSDFHLYLRFSGSSVSLQPGSYSLRKDMAYRAIVSALAGAPAATYQKVTIPEGLTVTETAERVQSESHIAAADFQAAATVATVVPTIAQPGISTLEGFLYPQTYFVSPTEDASQLVQEMVAQFVSETAGISWSSAPAGVTPYQVLVVASLIQNEAKATSDGPMIAAVIYNRLAARIPLGIDATVYYALDRPLGGTLTASDLAVKSPWNTRLYPGLPPTPISSPQLSSIQSALAPARTNDEYYVLGPDCIHNLFFSSYAAFQQAAASQPSC